MATPIFILGNPRSGSTAMSFCLRKILGIQGYAEGHFLKYITRYKKLTNEIFDNLKESEKNKNVAIGNINQEILFNNILYAFKNTYESLFDISQKYWVDKTPESLPVHEILSIWPNSKFIFLKRRSLENISSRIIKWPHASFEIHCKSWSKFMMDWYNLDKSQLNNFIEIEHYDMLFNTDKMVKSIINLLPEYSSHEEKIINFFSTNIVKAGGAWQSNQKPKILDIETIEWTKEQKKTHSKICAETLDLYNYSLDKNYFKF